MRKEGYMMEKEIAENVATTRRLIEMLLNQITDEKKLREIYLYLNRLFCK